MYVSEIMSVPFIITGEKLADKRSYKVSFDNFEKEAVGWLPSENLTSTVQELQTKLSPHLENLKDFRNGDLIRLNVLRKSVIENKLSKQLRILEN